MKLKNKITGEIKEFALFGGNELQGGVTLESLTKEWEDVPEEPKEHWCINEFGTPEMAGRFSRESIYDKSRKLIGNDFDTREEAEKAVEKLKAWKRLKDTYHIRFVLDFVENTISFTYRINDTLHSAVDEERIVFEDMKTFFGGEE